MNRDGSVVLGSARGSRAGEGGPPSRTFSFLGAVPFPSLLSPKSFRRTAETAHASRVCSPDCREALTHL